MLPHFAPMKSISACGVLLGLVTFSSCTSTGASAAGFQSGTQSAGIAFSLANDKLDDSFDEGEIESVDLSGNWGYFVSPNVEVGASLGYSSEQQSLNGTTFIDSDLTAIGINSRYYLVSEGQVRPYLGAGFGLLNGSSGDIDIDGNYYGLAAGLAAFLSESVALDARFTKAWSTEDWSDGIGTADIDRDMFAFLVGFTFYF